MAGFGTLETMFFDGFFSVAGDLIVLGIITFVFFLAFVIVQNTRLDHKVAILVPASFLALAFAPIFTFVVALVFAFMLYLVITKIMNR